MCRKEKTGVDRFSLRQAVIFICATNRPDELDLEFVRPGRIDRRVYIGLPDAKQRVQIFGVHSAGKQLSEDVDFEKVNCLLYSFLLLAWNFFISFDFFEQKITFTLYTAYFEGVRSNPTTSQAKRQLFPFLIPSVGRQWTSFLIT